MVLRVVAPARATRLAGSIDRDPSRRSGAGDPERVRRGPARQRTVEPDQRAKRAAARRYSLRADLRRQFRLTQDLGATLAEPAATTAIGPGPGPVWSPPPRAGRLRRLQQHRIESKPDGAVLDGHGPLRRDRRHSARAVSQSRSQPL